METLEEPKKIHRSITDKVFGGVIGGFAEYFKTDASLLRIIYVIISILSAAFPGLLVYLIAWMVIPPKPYV